MLYFFLYPSIYFILFYVNYVNFKGRLDSRPNYDNKGDTFDTFTGLKDKNALLADMVYHA